MTITNANLAPSLFDPPKRGEHERLTYSVHGLASRDELLLKSLIRLLDHKTVHHWTYLPEGGDLTVLSADEVFTGIDALLRKAGPHRLWVGHLKKAEPDFLAFPLRPADLEQTLNNLGARIAQDKLARQSAQAPRIEPQALYRLTKWPPAQMLNEAERVKMATMLSGRALSVMVLAQRTGLSVEACQQFCGELLAAELLQQVEEVVLSVSPSAAAPRLDIVSRIRLRLGLVPSVS